MKMDRTEKRFIIQVKNKIYFYLSTIEYEIQFKYIPEVINSEQHSYFC